MSADLSRRTLLSRTAAVAGATVLASFTGNVLPAHAEARPGEAQVPGRTVTGRPSLNGWETEKSADDGGNIWTRPVPGTPLDGVQVRMGDIETVLVHVVQRFHYEVDPLRRDDVAGATPERSGTSWPSPTSPRGRQSRSAQASTLPDSGAASSPTNS